MTARGSFYLASPEGIQAADKRHPDVPVFTEAGAGATNRVILGNQRGLWVFHLLIGTHLAWVALHTFKESKSIK